MAREYVGNMEFGRCPYAGAAAEWEEHGTIHTKVAGAWTEAYHAWSKGAGAQLLCHVYTKLSGVWRRMI